MPMILKTVENEWSPVASDNPHHVTSDVVSCSFSRYPDGSGANALLYVRDNAKSALVPGFVEHEKHVSFTGTAYLMNENGKTISSFTARASGDGGTGCIGDGGIAC